MQNGNSQPSVILNKVKDLKTSTWVHSDPSSFYSSGCTGGVLVCVQISK